jgi:predicted TIM-barrel fold metal-dependent hydrolase
VGLKSVIAYLTGLNIGPEDPAASASQYPAFRQEPYKQDFRALRDYCLHLGLQLCMAHNKPLQVHCGFGDDDIRFSLSAPHNMYDLLAFPPYSDCLVVLVHGGHPWASEAAIMANLLPNVYLDISQTCPFISYGVADVLWDVLQVAPLGKVLYGSDAFHLPELYWLGAKIGRYAVREVVSRLINSGFCSAEEGVQIAQSILHDNAVELYELVR